MTDLSPPEKTASNLIPRQEAIKRGHEKVGLHPNTIDKWVKAGKLRSIRPGYEVFVNENDLDQLLEERLEDLRLKAMTSYIRESGTSGEPLDKGKIKKLKAATTAQELQAAWGEE